MGSAKRIAFLLAALAVVGLYALLVAGLRGMGADARKEQCGYLGRTEAAIEATQGGERQTWRQQDGCALHGRDGAARPRGGA